MTLLFLLKKHILFFILFWPSNLMVKTSVLVYNNACPCQLNYVHGNTFVILFYYQVKQNNQCVD